MGKIGAACDFEPNKDRWAPHSSCSLTVSVRLWHPGVTASDLTIFRPLDMFYVNYLLTASLGHSSEFDLSQNT